jgi:hypothetical protein
MFLSLTIVSRGITFAGLASHHATNRVTNPHVKSGVAVLQIGMTAIPHSSMTRLAGPFRVLTPAKF